MGNSFYAYNDNMNYEVESGMDYSRAQMNEFAADQYGNGFQYGCGGNNYSKCQPCKPSNQNVCDDNVQLVGNSVNFKVCKDDGEIKADLVVGYRSSVRVWGQVKDCSGNAIGCAYVKLVKVTANGLVGIAHTITDCLGFYQFDICPCTDGCDFTIIVGKAATSGERCITNASTLAGMSCSPMNGNSPCDDSCGPCANPCSGPCSSQC